MLFVLIIAKIKKNVKGKIPLLFFKKRFTLKSINGIINKKEVRR